MKEQCNKKKERETSIDLHHNRRIKDYSPFVGRSHEMVIGRIHEGMFWNRMTRRFCMGATRHSCRGWLRGFRCKAMCRRQSMQDAHCYVLNATIGFPSSYVIVIFALFLSICSLTCISTVIFIIFVYLFLNISKSDLSYSLPYRIFLNLEIRISQNQYLRVPDLFRLFDFHFFSCESHFVVSLFTLVTLLSSCPFQLFIFNISTH